MKINIDTREKALMVLVILAVLLVVGMLFGEILGRSLYYWMH
nr:hypothetical protein [uncultured Sphingobacterium sp.]